MAQKLGLDVLIHLQQLAYEVIEIGAGSSALR
jgi:hypothetical protein